MFLHSCISILVLMSTFYANEENIVSKTPTFKIEMLLVFRFMTSIVKENNQSCHCIPSITHSNLFQVIFILQMRNINTSMDFFSLCILTIGNISYFPFWF